MKPLETYLTCHEGNPQTEPSTRSLSSRLTFVPGPGDTFRFMVTEEMPHFLSEAYACVSAGKPQQARQWLSADALEPLAETAAAGLCSAETCFLLGLTFFGLKDWEASQQWYEWTLQVCPHGLISYELGRICTLTNRTAEAMSHFERAYAVLPEHAGVCASHGTDLIRLGRTREGVTLLKKATELSPENALLGSNYLYSLSYLADEAPAHVRAAHEQWARRHASTDLARVHHPNDPDPDRRLRIGYVSSEFRRHSAAYNFEPYLDWRDRQGFELFGYGHVRVPDEVTARFAQKFDTYRDVRQLSHRALANLVQEDQIDILVAVGGHTVDNRLPAFAYKAAPIQIEYGAASTTGLAQIDYRLTDRWIDGPATEAYYTERPLYLEGGQHCYQPPQGTPDIGPLPMLKNGYVTYASFNNSCKISEKTLALWAEILRRAPSSRLMLKFRGAENASVQAHFAQRFRKLGISADRLRFHGWQPRGHHLALYNDADIALDTSPFGGSVTSFETLWMGLPIVTLVRDKAYWVSRVTASFLERTELGCFASHTEAQYVMKALALGADPNSLARIRASLRARMNMAGGLCDGKNFMCYVESAYRRVWRQWTHRVTSGTSGRETGVAVAG